MNKVAIAITAAGLAALIAAPAFAAPGRDDAIALVDRIAAAFAKDGKDKVLADVSNPAGPYVQEGGLYAYCMDYNMIMLAHGANKGLIGKDTSNISDPTGLKISAPTVAIAKDPGSGWVDYQWVNPATKKIEHKAAYVKRIGADFLCAAGIYK